MIGVILRFIALSAASGAISEAVNAVIDKLTHLNLGGTSSAIAELQGGANMQFADYGGGGSTTWGPGAMGPASPHKKRRRRARLTQSELTELMNIKNLLGKTAAANILPFYMGRGR